MCPVNIGSSKKRIKPVAITIPTTASTSSITPTLSLAPKSTTQPISTSVAESTPTSVPQSTSIPKPTASSSSIPKPTSVSIPTPKLISVPKPTTPSASVPLSTSVPIPTDLSIPKSTPIPTSPSSPTWFRDGSAAGNPVANQYYNPVNSTYKLITDWSVPIPNNVILVDPTTETRDRLPTDIRNHIIKETKQPPNPSDVVHQRHCNNYNFIKFSNNINGGFSNSFNTCWIAASLQILFAIRDIRNFFNDNIIVLPPSLQPVRTSLQYLTGTANASRISPEIYNEFFQYYHTSEQGRGQEGSVTVFLATFFHYLSKFLQTHPDNRKNLTFTNLNTFGLLCTYYYYFDASIKIDTKVIKQADIEADHGLDRLDLRYSLSMHTFADPLFPKEDVSDAIMSDLIRPDVTSTKGKDNPFYHFGSGQQRQVFAYRMEEYRYLPKILPIVVAPYLSQDLPPIRKMTGLTPDEESAIGTYLGYINICFTLRTPDSKTASTYFLIGIICFVGAAVSGGHFFGFYLQRNKGS